MRKPRLKLWSACVLSVLLVAVMAGAASAASKPPPGWPEKLLSDAGFVDVPIVMPGTHFAYGIVPTGYGAVYGRLDQLDLANGQLFGGEVVFSNAQLFQTGTTIGVVEPVTQSVGEAGQANPNQAPSLQIMRTIDGQGVRLLPGHYLSVVGRTGTAVVLATSGTTAAGGLWIAAHDHLLLVDPTTGVVLRKLAAPAPSIANLVVSPSGAQLYASGPLASVAGQPWAVYSVDAANGRVLAHYQYPIGDEPELSAATDSGVWVTNEVGFVASSELLTLPKLAPSQPSLVRAAAASSGSAYTVILGGTAWSIGQSTVACGAATSGALYAQAPLGMIYGNPERYEPFAVQSGMLYAIGLPSNGPPAGVLAIKPSGCKLVP
jgi:hypothetical protein